MRHATLALLASFSLLAVVSCDSDGDRVLERAAIRDVTAPGTAVAGEPVVIEIRTRGGGCTRKGHVRVSTNDEGAFLEPFDSNRRPGSGVACPLEIQTLLHEVPLTFEAPGAARVVVRGRRIGKNGMPAEIVDVERVMEVEP